MPWSDCRRGPWEPLPSTRGCVTDMASNPGRGASGTYTDGARVHYGRDWGPAVPQFLAVCPTPPRSRPGPWAEALALAMEVRTHPGSSCFPISCLAPVNFVFETPGGASSRCSGEGVAAWALLRRLARSRENDEGGRCDLRSTATVGSEITIRPGVR
jgi:hypothetical protein